MSALKPLAKSAGKFLGLVRATPHLICYALTRALLGRDRAFTGASEAINDSPHQAT